VPPRHSLILVLVHCAVLYLVRSVTVRRLVLPRDEPFALRPAASQVYPELLRGVNPVLPNPTTTFIPKCTPRATPTPSPLPASLSLDEEWKAEPRPDPSPSRIRTRTHRHLHAEELEDPALLTAELLALAAEHVGVVQTRNAADEGGVQPKLAELGLHAVREGVAHRRLGVGREKGA
jgi:hypothetical protein